MKVDEKIQLHHICHLMCSKKINNEQETISFSKLAAVLMLKPLCLPAVPRSGIEMLKMHII